MLAWDDTRRQGQRWILAAAAVLVSAGVLHAALPTEPDVSGATSLAGHLLIAAPDVRVPPFAHTVILLAQHNKEGAIGIVINRPGERRSIADLLAALGADAGGVTGRLRVFVGGPVDPVVGFVIHSAEYRRKDTLDIDGRVALTAAAPVLRDIALGKGPRKSLVAFGFAGWQPGQLDEEVANGVWLTVPEDPALVFDDDRAKVWTDALARHKTHH